MRAFSSSRRGHLADDELLHQVGAGDREAYAELWRRHSHAGLRAAQGFRNLADPDDLVAEAFTRILHALTAGRGPSGAFRPYLYATIRNVALNDARTPTALTNIDLETVPGVEATDDSLEAALNSSLTAAAFRGLPPRWQTVLWYTEVERLSPPQTAELMGLKPNAVSALAFRARRALRAAWLQQHVAPGEEHRDILDRLGEYNQGTLSTRDEARVRLHLEGCMRCRIIAEEIDEVSGRLALVLLPLVLGSGAALVFARSIAAGSVVAASTAGPPPTSGPTHPSAAMRLARFRSGLTAPVLIAAGVVVIGGAGAFALAVAPAPPHPALSSVASVPSPSPKPSISPHPAPTATPTDPPTVAPPPAGPAVAAPRSSRVRTPPPASAPPAAPVVDTTAPAAPVLTSTVSNTEETPPVFAGTGEPGDTLTVTDSSGTVLATTTVAPDGTWSTGEIAGLSPTLSGVRISQTDSAGNVSPMATYGPFAFVPVIDAPLSGATFAPEEVPLNLTGWPGASVKLTLNGVPFGPYVFDSNGNLSLVAEAGGLALPVGSYSVTAVYGDGTAMSTGTASVEFTIDVG